MTESAGSEPASDETATDTENVEVEKTTEPAATAATEATEAADAVASKEPKRELHLAISLRSALTGAVIVALVSAVAVLAWLYVGAERRIEAQELKTSNDKHAEEVALNYAVRAAEMNFQDLAAWKVKLVEGTGPELNEKLSKAAQEMEQILVPLEWTSTARPLVAKVRSENGGIYVVDSFVSVLTKTVQAPEPLQSTATYSITLDSNNDWQITDVGGIGSVVEQK